MAAVGPRPRGRRGLARGHGPRRRPPCDDVRRSHGAAIAVTLVRKLVAARVQAALGPQVEREKLPRAELRSRTATARTDARRAVAERLAKEVQTAAPLLRPSWEIERLCLAAEIGDAPANVEAEARELLLSTGSAADGPGAVVRERSVLVLSYIAVRRNAPEGLADRVAALLQDRLAADRDALDWRWAIFRLLVALDRPEDLETALRSWILPAEVESRWRIALGYLFAESSRVTLRLREAAEQFEEVARLDELGETEFVALAGWYLALGEDSRREIALDRRYDKVEEWTLRNRVSSARRRIEGGGPDGVPVPMDDEILRMLRILLTKSSDPRNAFYEVRELYDATKDVRVLACLADGAVGHSPETAYPFLNMTWQLIRNIHEEATCDELVARIAARRAIVRTDTDRRALTLLLAQTERRAAEVLNQPGLHAERAVAALKEARRGTWQRGERRLVAEFLATLGKLPLEVMAVEQVAQLRELHQAEATGSVDRLWIANALWRTEWEYDRRDAAVDGLLAALEEFRQASGGLIPAEATDLAGTAAEWQESLGHFQAGEAWLTAELAHQVAAQQREWYERRIFSLWVNCLRAGGTVSLGSGAELYRGARERMRRALFEHLPDHAREIVNLHSQLHIAAHVNAKVPGVGDDLVEFSRTALVELLPRFGAQSADVVRGVAEAIRRISGPLPALTLLVEQFEREPVWRSGRRARYGAWGHLGYRAAEWRREAGALGALEPRLLRVVLRELERDLVSENSRGRYVYGDHNQREFWREKAEDFAQTARRVIAEHADSPGILRYTAEYLANDLGLRDEAIAVLEAADARGMLLEDGRWRLVQWYHELKNDAGWRASLPHLRKLTAARPDNFQYALALIRTLHNVAQDEEGKSLLDATAARCKDLVSKRRMGTGANAQLADLALDCGWFDRCPALYELAISERRAYWRRQNGPDSEISRLYANLSRARTGLGLHDEAVDAASAAVVVWGTSNSGRQNALHALREALAAIPDLPAWTARWEESALKSGMDAPVVRLALARIHLDRKEPDAALRHLMVARVHTPDDAQVLADIVRANEMKKDDAGVAEALTYAVSHVPRQPDLYVQLAERLTKLGLAEDAERALTGLAEYAPNDAEGHRLLAEIRGKAKRWDDAVVQWRQVVRIRTQEADGWVGVARAQAAAGRKDEARATLEEALGTLQDAEQLAAATKALEKVR